MRFACNVYCEVELTTTSGWEAAPHGCIVHGVRDTHPRICRFNLMNTFVAIERCDTSNARGKTVPPQLRCLFGSRSDGSCAFSCSTLELQVSALPAGCQCTRLTSEFYSFAVPSH